jgi:FAD/FMN-containing dehydrogenase
MANDPLDTSLLKQNFSGEIILPTASEYELAKNTIVATGSPAVILRPKTSQDVATAIAFAQEKSLLFSVRSGGHSLAGFSTNDGGLVLDLKLMSSVEVTPSNLVKIGGGAVWGEIVQTLKPLQLALTSGDTTSVGVGGLTLGGGIGWMVRKYGLAIDSLVAAEVVTAEGKILRASEKENQDLFWALRGGGGNFGVVTSFEFKPQPVAQVFAGQITLTLDNLDQTITSWRDYMRTADQELTTSLTLMPSFGEAPPSVMILLCYAGEEEAKAMKAIDPLKALSKVTKQEISKKAYADVLEVAHPPQGIRVVAKNIFAKELTDEMIQKIVASTTSPGMRVIQIRSLGGVMREIAEDKTAFGYRQSEVMMFVGAFIPLDATNEQSKDALKPWEGIARLGEGAYAGFISTNTDEDTKSLYPQKTWERLVEIKTKYDPTNFFRANFNIKPNG